MIAIAHRYIGISIVVALLYLAVYGVVARIAGRHEVGRPFWGVLYYTETVLVIQIIAGTILLFMGRRVGGSGFDLHYLYGSLFPFVVILGGRLYALRRDDRDYVPIAWAGFIAFGLTTRALMTGLGIG